MKCPRCGSYVGPDKKFCMRCGCPVERDRGVNKRDASNGRGRAKHLRWATCLVAAIAVGAAAYMLSARGVGIGTIADGLFNQSATERTAYYGGSSKLHVGLTSKITVYGLDGDPIDDGEVQLIPQGGSAVENGGYEVLNFRGGGTFSLSDYSDLALGTYCMRVFEGNQRKKAYEYPNVVVDLADGDGRANETVEFKVALSRQGLKTVSFYGVEETKQTVNVTYKNEGDTKGYSNQRAYVQMTEANDDISGWPINKKLKAQFDEMGVDTHGWTARTGRPLRVGYAQGAVMIDQLRGFVSIKCSYSDVGLDGQEVDGASGELLDVQTGDTVKPESYFGISREKRNEKARSAVETYATKRGLRLDETSIGEVLENDGSYLVTADDLYVLLNPSESGETAVQLLPLSLGKATPVDG